MIVIEQDREKKLNQKELSVREISVYRLLDAGVKEK